MKKTYRIIGMHCTSCAMIIENSLEKIEGVKDANVNFANEKAVVSFDENKVAESRIAEVIATN